MQHCANPSAARQTEAEQHRNAVELRAKADLLEAQRNVKKAEIGVLQHRVAQIVEKQRAAARKLQALCVVAEHVVDKPKFNLKEAGIDLESIREWATYWIPNGYQALNHDREELCKKIAYKEREMMQIIQKRDAMLDKYNQFLTGRVHPNLSPPSNLAIKCS